MQVPWTNAPGRDFYKDAKINVQYKAIVKGVEKTEDFDSLLTPQKIDDLTDPTIKQITSDSVIVTFTIINEDGNPPLVLFVTEGENKIDNTPSWKEEDNPPIDADNKQILTYELINLDYDTNYDIEIWVGSTNASIENFTTEDKFTEFTPIWITFMVLSLVVTTIATSLLIIKKTKK